MIPRTIHYCWYGDRPMPAAHHKYVDGWRRMLPGYEFVFWNEDNSPMHLPYLDTARAGGRWVNLSNFIRLYSVYHHGGVYLDTDVEVVRSLDPVLSQSKCFFGYQIPAAGHAENDVNNAVFGAEKNHPFVARQLEAIQVLYDGMETEYLSGPHLTTFLLRSNGWLGGEATRDERDIRIYPREYFFPYSWLEKFDPSCVTEHTFTIHHWAAMWGEGDGGSSRLASIRALPGLKWLGRRAGGPGP